MINRRFFLGATVLGLLTNKLMAQTTPNPPKWVSETPPSDQDGALADALSSLAPGESVEFTPAGWNSSNTVNGYALNWQTRGFHDPERQEVRFIGKAQSSQGSPYGPGSHFVYDLSTGNLRVARIDAWASESGHLYDAPAYDEVTGDLYWARYNSDKVRCWRHGASLTSFEENVTSPPESGIQSIMAGGSTFASSGEVASAWHPNLYGVDDPGLVVMCNEGIGAWRKSTDSWEVLVNYASATSGSIDRAVCLYVKGLNAVIGTIGTERQAWRIDVGPMVTRIADTPQTFGHAKPGAALIDDPDQGATCYAFEKTGSSTKRVWRYDAGNWAQIPGLSHPFTSSDSDRIVFSVVPLYGLNAWWAFERHQNSIRGRLFRKPSNI